MFDMDAFIFGVISSVIFIFLVFVVFGMGGSIRDEKLTTQLEVFGRAKLGDKYIVYEGVKNVSK